MDSCDPSPSKPEHSEVSGKHNSAFWFTIIATIIQYPMESYITKEYRVNLYKSSGCLSSLNFTSAVNGASSKVTAITDP